MSRPVANEDSKSKAKMEITEHMKILLINGEG